jgi:hypothetical protein
MRGVLSLALEGTLKPSLSELNVTRKNDEAAYVSDVDAGNPEKSRSLAVREGQQSQASCLMRDH